MRNFPRVESTCRSLVKLIYIHTTFYLLIELIVNSDCIHLQVRVMRDLTCGSHGVGVMRRHGFGSELLRKRLQGFSDCNWSLLLLQLLGKVSDNDVAMDVCGLMLVLAEIRENIARFTTCSIIIIIITLRIVVVVIR